MTIVRKLFPALIMLLAIATGCKKDSYNFKDLSPTVKSFYTITSTGFEMGDELQFKNESLNAQTYSWDFGDGTKSTEVSPKKVYSTPGIYLVALTAVGPGGTGNYSAQVTIIDPNASVGDKELYFIEYNNPIRSVRKISLNPGSTAETVVSLSGRAGVGLAFDAVNKKIYSTDFLSTGAGKVWRFNSDGTSMEAVVSGINDPYGIAVNAAGGKIYWADGESISRANLDGTGYQKDFIKITGGLMRAVAYNSKTDMIYFYEVNVEDLYMAKADGTGATKIVEGAYGYSLYVDETNSKIYFDDRNTASVKQANLDGTGVVKFGDAPGRVYGMSIDYGTNKFYWSDISANNIKRANLDGTGVEVFLSGLSSPRGLIIKKM